MNSTGKIRTASLAIGGAALGLLSLTSPAAARYQRCRRNAAFDEVQLPRLPHRGQEARRTVVTRRSRRSTRATARRSPKLEQKVKNGGTGVWGAIPMPPNNVPDADHQDAGRMDPCAEIRHAVAVRAGSRSAEDVAKEALDRGAASGDGGEQIRDRTQEARGFSHTRGDRFVRHVPVRLQLRAVAKHPGVVLSVLDDLRPDRPGRDGRGARSPGQDRHRCSVADADRGLPRLRDGLSPWPSGSYG